MRGVVGSSEREAQGGCIAKDQDIPSFAPINCLRIFTVALPALFCPATTAFARNQAVAAAARLDLSSHVSARFGALRACRAGANAGHVPPIAAVGVAVVVALRSRREGGRTRWLCAG